MKADGAAEVFSEDKGKISEEVTEEKSLPQVAKTTKQARQCPTCNIKFPVDRINHLNYARHVRLCKLVLTKRSNRRKGITKGSKKCTLCPKVFPVDTNVRKFNY